MSPAIDTKVAKWIHACRKAGQGGPQTDQLHALVRHLSPQQREVVDRLESLVANPGEKSESTEKCLNLLKRLHELGWKRTAEEVLEASLPKLSGLSPLAVIPFLPSATSVERWRKAANIPPVDLEREFKNWTDITYATVGADWLMAHGRVESSRDTDALLRKFLERQPRQRPLDPPELVLERFVAKDAKGTRLAALLQVANELTMLGNLAEAVGASRKSFDALWHALGFLGSDRAPTLPLSPFLRTLFARTPALKGAKRRQACARISRAASELLSIEKLSESGRSALTEIAAIGRELRLVTRDLVEREETWTTEPANRGGDEAERAISPAGAQHWATVYEKAVSTGEGVAALEVLGHNLGFREIETRGARVAYSPRLHEDVEGELIPGDIVEILTSGWSFKDQPLIRARVRKPPSS